MPSCNAHWFQVKDIEIILIGINLDETTTNAVNEFVYFEDLINTTKADAYEGAVRFSKGLR